MRCLAVFAFLSIISWTTGSGPRDYFPPDAKLIISINVRSLPATGEGPGSLLSGAIANAAAFLGLNAKPPFERLWIVGTENYPRGTLLVANGHLDVEKVRGKYQELTRDRKQTSRLFKENDLTILGVETPNAIHTLPGVTQTVYLTISNDSLLAAFEKETLAAAVAQVANINASPSRDALLKQVDQTADLSFAADVPPILSGPQAIFMGVTTMQGTGQFGLRFRGKCQLTTGQPQTAQMLAERLKNGVTQCQQLLPAMLPRGGDRKIVTWLLEELKSARIETQTDGITVMFERPEKGS